MKAPQTYLDNCWRTAAILAWVVAGGGVIVLMGWVLDLSFLKSIETGFASMKPSTALAFTLGGLGLWFQLPSRSRFQQNVWGIIAGVGVAFLGALNLGEYLTGTTLEIERMVLWENKSGAVMLGRMSPATAFVFLLYGFALILMRWKYRRWHPSSVLTIVGLCVGFTGLVGYLYGVETLYSFLPFSSMAVHTALFFVLLGCALLAAQPEQGVMRIVSSSYLGGWVARRLLPVVFGIPVLLGQLRLVGERMRFFGSEMGTSLLIVASVMLTAILVWFCARALNRMHQDYTARHRDGAQLEAIVNASEDAIIDMDLDDVITGWNPAAEKIFGYEKQEIIGQSKACIYPPDRMDEMKTIKEAISNGDRVDLEDTVRLNQAGERVPVSVLVTPIRDELGGLIGASALIRDQRDRVEILHNLEESLREVGRFKTALDYHAIVAITDPNGQINYVNQKFCDVSQYSEAELVGHDHGVVSSHFHPRSFFDAMWSRIKEGSVWQGEIKNQAKDGSVYWIETTIVPFTDEAGVPYQFMSIGADITEEKNASESLLRQTEDLQRSNEELQQFAYAASHDLQEPLRAVAGCLQLLGRKLGDRLSDSEAELMRHTVEGSERMKALIEGLLELSRVGTRGQKLLPVKLDSILDAALQNLELAVEESAAVITRDKLPELQGDCVQLIQLFQNLVGNALKFKAEAAPCIHIGAVRREDAWEITVTDNGIGIDEKYADRIFTIFQRLHTRRQFAGTGIGLTLCRKIMDRHGGAIAVESSLGKGATFRCTFPDFIPSYAPGDQPAP